MVFGERREVLELLDWDLKLEGKIESISLAKQLPDGRIRLDYWNDRREPVDVLLKAKRRVSPE